LGHHSSLVSAAYWNVKTPCDAWCNIIIIITSEPSGSAYSIAIAWILVWLHCIVRKAMLLLDTWYVSGIPLLAWSMA
jgi:hypothetical protein